MDNYNFLQVYLISKGDCLYQGATHKLVPYLESIKLPCPMYHNPADYSMYDNLEIIIIYCRKLSHVTDYFKITCKFCIFKYVENISLRFSVDDRKFTF